MQRFDRTTEAPPGIFQSDLASRERHILRDYLLSDPDKRSQSSAPRSELPLEDPVVLEALRRLFRGKCAFCEAVDILLPFRFRPAAEALPPEDPSTSHLYYSWLADTWENIYAICPICVPEDRDYFPVTGRRTQIPNAEQLDRFVEYGLGSWAPFPPRETPVLLDPCARENFPRSFLARVDGNLSPLSTRGAVTIKHFNLNSAPRVTGRRNRYAEYFDRLIEALRPDAGEAEAAELFDFGKLEFGGTWYLLLRRLARQVGGEAGVNPIVSPSRISRAFSPMAGQVGTERRLRDGWRRLVEEDGADTGELGFVAPPRPGKAQLARVQLSNFKAIESLELILPNPKEALASDRPPSAPSLLIIGENAAGKSSILEAIALAVAGAAARQQLGLAAQTFILNPAYLGAPGAARPERAQVTLTATDGTVNRLDIAMESMREVDRGFDPPSVFAYGAFRQYQHRRTRHSAAKYIRNLFDGSVLSNPERWLLDLDAGKFLMVARALREIFSIEGEYEVIERDPQVGRCFIVAAADPSGKTLSRTPFSLASSGFRSVLAMACDVMHGLMDPKVNPGFETLASARGVVLVDEVEAHLHPRWKMQIMRGLRRALPAVTFIATTHDPLCLRGMEEGEVVVLQRVAAPGARECGLPVFVEQLTQLPNVAHLRVEQLLTSDFFQLYSTDAPEIEAQLAAVGDLLAKRTRGEELLPTEAATLATFDRDIAQALPIGMSEAHRLVQEAVAEYLKDRRAASQAKMQELRGAAKTRILAALRSI